MALYNGGECVRIHYMYNRLVGGNSLHVLTQEQSGRCSLVD